MGRVNVRIARAARDSAGEMCSICLDDDPDGMHQLECGHSFHSACLITWLRRGRLSCPNCRDDLHLASEISSFALFERCKFICNTVGRRKNAPPMLTRMMTRLRNAKQKETDARRAYREFTREHSEVMKRANALRATKWRTRQSVSRATRLIGLFDCPDLILPSLHVGH